MGVDWQAVWKTILVATGGIAAVVLAAAWAVKTAIAAWIARDTEAFKARLKADADTEIEKLKSSLQRTATEHQVMFSRLHEKRAEVIEIVYSRLTDLYFSAQRFITTCENNPSPEKSEEFNKLRETFWEVFTFIEQRRIFLPQNLCELVDRHLGTMRRTVIKAGVYGTIEYPTVRTAEQIQRTFMEAYQELETDIPAARRALEEEFRRMLGVESS
jgi:hypothetical protein